MHCWRREGWFALGRPAERKKSPMGRYTIRKFKLRVGRSRTGKGVFACEDIPKDACIVEYTGRVVSAKEKENDRGRYNFWVSATKMVNGNVRSNRARYINHSCRPNCTAEGPRGRVFILARRRIKAGEELTYNYGKEYFDAFIKPKGCRCAKCDDGLAGRVKRTRRVSPRRPAKKAGRRRRQKA